MKLNEYVVYGLLIIILLVGIGFLLKTDPSKLFKSVNNQNNKVSDIGDTSIGRKVEFEERQEGKQVVSNYWGEVVKWNYEKDVLTLKYDGVTTDYQIDKDSTNVQIGKSQNNNRDTKLYQINKYEYQMHWQQAFCPGDSVTLLTKQEDKMVVWIMNSDYRSCGFKEILK